MAGDRGVRKLTKKKESKLSITYYDFEEHYGTILSKHFYPPPPPSRMCWGGAQK